MQNDPWMQQAFFWNWYSTHLKLLDNISYSRKCFFEMVFKRHFHPCSESVELLQYCMLPVQFSSINGVWVLSSSHELMLYFPFVMQRCLGNHSNNVLHGLFISFYFWSWCRCKWKSLQRKYLPISGRSAVICEKFLRENVSLCRVYIYKPDTTGAFIYICVSRHFWHLQEIVVT